MLMRELRQAVLGMRAVSERHGAAEEVEALDALVRAIEPYGDMSVKRFVSLARERAAAANRGTWLRGKKTGSAP